NLVSKRSAKHQFRRQIFEAWSDLCAYCEKPADTLDHVKPRHRGGATVVCNLVPACKNCNRKNNFAMLEDFVECMANNGVDVCGQVGSNWVHASGLGVDGIRDFCARLSDVYETPFHMAGYAMVEALRAMNVEKVALNACYHPRSWYQGTVGFLKEAGFDVLWAGNFHDQGWFATQEEVDNCIWCFDEDLLWSSFDYVAEQAPQAEAYLINGMSNYRRPSDGLAQRPVHHEKALENRLGKPIIGHDTALYWRLFKTLGLAPETDQGRLLSSLKEGG
ncbi:MAG: HNH endonuclease, partial [Alphaproteobacteria bacterium]|nr:HNH endonuclease [Alphaproteobacteria bacterium]